MDLPLWWHQRLHASRQVGQDPPHSAPGPQAQVEVSRAPRPSRKPPGGPPPSRLPPCPPPHCACPAPVPGSTQTARCPHPSPLPRGHAEPPTSRTSQDLRLFHPPHRQHRAPHAPRWHRCSSSRVLHNVQCERLHITRSHGPFRVSSVPAASPLTFPKFTLFQPLPCRCCNHGAHQSTQAHKKQRPWASALPVHKRPRCPLTGLSSARARRCRAHSFAPARPVSPSAAAVVLPQPSLPGTQ